MSGNLEDQLSEMEKDRDYWKEVALYLASCHAATAEGEAMLKSVSASRKARLFSICRKAADMLSRQAGPPRRHHGETLDRILTRLRDAKNVVP